MVIGTTIYLPLIFALGIGLVEYWSKRVDLRHKSYIQKLVSFSAGVSITYALLELFPLFTEAAFAINKLLFLSVLFGFTIHHFIEKEIYQHNKRFHLIKTISLEENIFYYVYHLILGIVLVTFTKQSLVVGTLFFFSILSYTIVGNLPSFPHKSSKKALLLSSSTLIGTLFATLVWVNRAPWIEFALIGLATGVLLFTVTRHHIPFGRKGSVGYFALGFIFYSVLIISSWYI